MSSLKNIPRSVKKIDIACLFVFVTVSNWTITSFNLASCNSILVVKVVLTVFKSTITNLTATMELHDARLNDVIVQLETVANKNKQSTSIFLTDREAAHL